MALQRKYNTIILNALLSIVACLVVNFSYLLAIREQDRRDSNIEGWRPEQEGEPTTGRLQISPDGYGYILHSAARTQPQGADSLAAAPRMDSIYVSSRLIRRLDPSHGSCMTVTTLRSPNPLAKPFVFRILEIDGEPFDYGRLYNNPDDRTVMSLQLAFYLAFTFILLTIMTAGGAARNLSVKFYLTRAAYCVALAVAMWLLLPTLRPRSGELIVTAMTMPDVVNPIDAMKCSFVLILALLYGRTYQLIHQREGIMTENEQLKSENLRSRYNTLVNQVNPHFLFNSLNSLSALVRDGDSADALLYIDRLSDTFRYTMRGGADITTTLGEELEFVGAYKYLLEVRYADKLFIDIDVEPSRLDWRLPTFSIQPLVENAVKHNAITRARPLHIFIGTRGDRLVVSNPVNPKIESEVGDGIGLENLARRLHLITGQQIEVVNDAATFSVSLPLIAPDPHAESHAGANADTHPDAHNNERARERARRRETQN